jgi:hypothetical protein
MPKVSNAEHRLKKRVDEGEREATIRNLLPTIVK